MSSTYDAESSGEASATIGGGAWLLSAALLGLAALLSMAVSEWLWAPLGIWAVASAAFAFWLPRVTTAAPALATLAGAVAGVAVAAAIALLGRGAELFWVVAAVQALAAVCSLVYLRRLDQRRPDGTPNQPASR